MNTKAIKTQCDFSIMPQTPHTPSTKTCEDILTFWLGECSPDDWYVVNPDLDADITRRFGPAWQEAWDGRLTQWLDTARGALAYLILTDQFPRNMFRGQAKAFATDQLALQAAKNAIAQDFDLDIDGLARQFFYLPFEHAEDIADQDRAVEFVETRFDNEKTLLHAKAHREVIRRFGRFPYRNNALGRETTAEEQAFLDGGGYGAIVRELEAG